MKTLQISKLIKNKIFNNYNIVVSFTNFLIYLTWLYSVHFLGALPENWLSLSGIFLIVLPSIILFLLSKFFKNNKVEININPFFLSILFVVFILLNYNGNSLFNDEISYAQNSYKLVTGISIYLYKLMPVLANYEILTIYRLINFVLILAPAYLIFNYNKSNKLLISVILLVLIACP